MGLIGRLVIAWVTVALFLVFGTRGLLISAPSCAWRALYLAFVVILWCALGVVEQADHLAGLLGEPLGTLVLTLSIVIIEAVLIAAVAFGSETSDARARYHVCRPDDRVEWCRRSGSALGRVASSRTGGQSTGRRCLSRGNYSAVGDCALHAGRA